MPASGVEVTGRARVRVERWRDELVASDPGGMRLFTAGRTVASLVLALGVLYAITRPVGQPITVALLGVVISMLAASAVNDPDPHQQRVTLALLPLPAAASVTLGALLAGSRFAGAGVLVGISFSATWARRFGPRGTALGMVAFMGYFFALFLGAQVGELPWLVLAIVVGAACSGLVRFVVLRDRPERRLRRVLRALRARITSVINMLLEVVADGEVDERRRRRLRHHMVRLNEAALVVEGQLEQVKPDEVRYGGTEPEVALAVLDLELGVGRLADAATRAATDTTCPQRRATTSSPGCARCAPSCAPTRCRRPPTYSRTSRRRHGRSSWHWATSPRRWRGWAS